MNAAHGRIEGLVTWRALLMLGGLVLHATMGQEDFAPFAIVNIVSGSFRMGAFFMISGLLTGFALGRPGDGSEWLQRRMLRLAIPTLFGLAVICPVVRLLLAAGDGGRLPALSVYHLWFMVALLDYTALAWLVHRADRIWPIFRRFEAGSGIARLRQSLLIVGTGTLSFVLMIRTAAVTGGWSGDEASLFRPLPLVIGYAPMFLLGLACGRMPTLRRILVAGVRVPVAVIAAAGAAHLLLRAPWLPALPPATADYADEVLLIAGAAFCPPAATALILRSAFAIRHVPVVLRRLSAASLTMYLLHYPLMLAIRTALAPLGPSPWAGFALLLAGGGSLSYLAHTHGVMRSRRLALLLNGHMGPMPERVAARG